MDQQEFWQIAWSGFKPFALAATTVPGLSLSDRRLVELIGDVRNLRVLELGCGNGLLSVHLAMHGATVTAIDNVELAVANTQALARFNQVEGSVTALVMDAMDLQTLGQQFDLVVGKFILHHIEPLDTFCGVLSAALRDGGRGLFLENNSRNRILMFCRKHLTGRWSIPRYGQPDEYPFEPREVDVLRAHFDRLEVHCPEFYFFGLADDYLVRRRLAWLSKGLRAADAAVFRYAKPLHKYSYHQILEITNRIHAPSS